MATREGSDPTEILSDLSRRPALNGGFERLQRQQTKQMADLRQIKRRMRRVETWQAKVDRRMTWALGLLGSIATPVVGRAVYDLLTKLVHMVH